MLEMFNKSKYYYSFISFYGSYNIYIKININTFMVGTVTCQFIDRVLWMSLFLICHSV